MLLCGAWRSVALLDMLHLLLFLSIVCFVHGGPLSFPVTKRVYLRTLSSAEHDHRIVRAPIRRTDSMAYAKVYVGTPKQEFLMQLDTGSSDFVIRGVPSAVCPKVHVFQANASNSAAPTQCRSEKAWVYESSFETRPTCAFNIEYGAGNKMSCVVMEDRLSFGVGAKALQATAYLGLILAENHPVPWCNGADGIFGLGFDEDAMSGFPGPLGQLIRGSGLANVYSLYVGSRMGADDGALTIGGIDSRLFVGEVKYVPLVEQGKYSVSAHALEVAGRRVATGPEAFGNMQVDSGTTLTYVPAGTFSAIKAFMQRHYCHMPKVCGADNATFFIRDDNEEHCVEAAALPKGYPVMRWHLANGVTVDVPPEVYFKQLPGRADPDKTRFCFGIRPLSDIPVNQGSCLLGDTFMAAAYIVFDRERLRMGFARPTKFSLETDPERRMDLPTAQHRARTHSVILSRVRVLDYVLAVTLVVFATASAMVCHHQQQKKGWARGGLVPSPGARQYGTMGAGDAPRVATC